MAVEQFIEKNFHPRSMRTIEAANAIIAEYQAQGFELTLRQLYYQFVARAMIENSLQSYKSLGSVVNDARLAGLIDWDGIAELMQAENEDLRFGVNGDAFEVWVEHSANRSQRFYFETHKRLCSYSPARERQEGVPPPISILCLGDLDPMRSDFANDVRSRLAVFGCSVPVHRVALTDEHVAAHDVPLNPFKNWSRKRPKAYELAALCPITLSQIIDQFVSKHGSI